MFEILKRRTPLYYRKEENTPEYTTPKPNRKCLKLQRLEGNTFAIPSYATQYSAGIDFRACLSNKTHIEQITISPGETKMISLGYRAEIESDCVMKLYVRSSIGKKGLVLANGTGIIDSDYRGELIACVRNVSNEIITIKNGDRMVQAIIQKYEQCDIQETKELSDTSRGEGGFGSTGS